MQFYNSKYTSLLAVLFIFLIAGCKKPGENISLVVNTSNLVKYSGIIHIRDAANSGTIPGNLSVTLTGPDADDIYDIAGKKNFTVHDGDVQFMLNPNRAITSTISFYLQINADGYLPVTRQVTITPSRQSQQVYVSMVNLAAPPAGTNIAKAGFKLNKGVMPALGAMKIGANGVVPFTGDDRNHVAFNSGLQSDTTYYDDGLTTVVLPKGTGFYYYVYKQTGTGSYTDSTSETRLEVDSTKAAGDTTKYYTRLVTYYTKQTITYPIGIWERTPFTGDSVNVIAFYSAGRDISLSAYLYGYGNYSAAPGIGLLNGTIVPEDEILFKSAVSKKLNDLAFVGTLNGKKFIISPDEASNWFTSFKLNPNFINPQTGLKLSDKDSLEIGIDVTTLKTVRQVVNKAPNGELRASIQSTDMGFYYHAPYITNFNYSFNTTQGVIPDNENLYSYIIMNNCFGAWLYGNTGAYYFNGKICSANAIAQGATINDYYWFNNLYTATAGNGSSTNIFESIDQTKLLGLTTYDISVRKAGSDVSTKPTGYAYAGGAGLGAYGAGIINMVNGHWETKAVPLNTKLQVSGWFGGNGIDTSVVIRTPVNYFEVTYK